MPKQNLSAPDYLICCDCETPCYVFEWRENAVREAVCESCGNEEASTFLTEEQYEAYAYSGAWSYKGR
jgi:hypothetical protein